MLIVLYVGSQLLSTLLMSTTTDRTQRMIFLALPFVFVIFIINFPAGLLVYWITTNLWTIVQQAIIRKRLGPMRPPGQEGGMGLGELLRGERVEHACPGRCGVERRQPAEGPAERPAAGAAAAQEEALGTAPMSEAADRVEELLGQVIEALALDAEVVSRRTRTASGRRSRATTSACSSAATARRSTPSSTWRSRSRTATPAATRRCA